MEWEQKSVGLINQRMEAALSWGEQRHVVQEHGGQRILLCFDFAFALSDTFSFVVALSHNMPPPAPSHPCMQDTHAIVYKQLGDWVRACYGTPLASTSGIGYTYTLQLPAGSTFDRIQLKEDTLEGQRVRNYTISYSMSFPAADSSVSTSNTTVLARESAIGVKRILLLDRNISVPVTGVAHLLFSVNAAVATPIIKQFAAFKPCPTGQLA